MSKQNVIEFMRNKTPVLDRYDGYCRTGVVVEVVNDRFAIVDWNEEDGEGCQVLDICEIKNLIEDDAVEAMS